MLFVYCLQFNFASSYYTRNTIKNCKRFKIDFVNYILIFQYVQISIYSFWPIFHSEYTFCTFFHIFLRWNMISRDKRKTNIITIYIIGYAFLFSIVILSKWSKSDLGDIWHIRGSIESVHKRTWLIPIYCCFIYSGGVILDPYENNNVIWNFMTPIWLVCIWTMNRQHALIWHGPSLYWGSILKSAYCSNFSFKI